MSKRNGFPAKSTRPATMRRPLVIKDLPETVRIAIKKRAWRDDVSYEEAAADMLHDAGIERIAQREMGCGVSNTDSRMRSLLAKGRMKPVSFDWDDAKAAENLAKHGVGFLETMTVFDDDRAAVRDDRRPLRRRASSLFRSLR